MKRIEFKKKKTSKWHPFPPFLNVSRLPLPFQLPQLLQPWCREDIGDIMVIPLLFILSETCSFDRFCRMLLPKNLNENTFVTEHLWAYDSLKWSRIEGWSTINCTWEVLYYLYCMFSSTVQPEGHHAIGAVAAIAAIGTVAAVVAKVAVVTISAKAATSQIPQILRFWNILWHIVTVSN